MFDFLSYSFRFPAKTIHNEFTRLEKGYITTITRGKNDCHNNDTLSVIAQ